MSISLTGNTMLLFRTIVTGLIALSYRIPLLIIVLLSPLNLNAIVL